MIHLLIFQATRFCNIDCKYCYLPNRTDRSTISDTIVRKTCNRIIDEGLVGDRLTISWHAGEPFSASPVLLSQLLDATSPLLQVGVQVKHAFQTNAMLLGPRFESIVTRPDVSIGISLDGPPDLHDSQRVTRRGSGTHSSAMQGVAWLRSVGKPFDAICVLTSKSLTDPEGIYDFFVSAGVRQLGFNVEEVEGTNRTSSLNDAHFEDTRRFFAKLFSYHEKAPRLRLREYDEYRGHFARGAPMMQSSQTQPFTMLTVSSDGSWSTFSPELLGHEWRSGLSFAMGSVTDPAPLNSSIRFQEISQEIQSGVDACRSECQFFRLCGGGAPSNKFFEHGTFAATRTIACTLGRIAIAEGFMDAVIASRRLEDAMTPAE